MMSYSYPSSFSDHYRAYRTAFHRKPAAWLGYAFFVGVPLGIAALAVALRGWTIEEVWTQQWYLLIGGPAFVILGVPFLHRLNVQQQRAGNAAQAGEQSVAFSDDGFRAWGPLQNTSVLWSGVHSVVETRQFFLIYLSEVHFFFLPKRVVGDASALRELLREKLGVRANLAPHDQAAT
jgi:YcxB-like protein